MNSTFLMTAGRTLLGLYFLLPGIMKFTAWDMHIALMETHGIPAAAPLLAIAAGAEVIAGVFLILRSHVRLAALGGALLIIIINIFMHGFWNFEGITRAHETQSFIKNLGIFAGLLVLASVSPKRQLSPKGLLSRDPKLGKAA